MTVPGIGVVTALTFCQWSARFGKAPGRPRIDAGKADAGPGQTHQPAAMAGPWSKTSIMAADETMVYRQGACSCVRGGDGLMQLFWLMGEREGTKPVRGLPSQTAAWILTASLLQPKL